MLTYDKLQQVFERARKPYWTLYKGGSKGVQIGTNSTISNSDEKPTISDAWDDLNAILESYGDGIYTLECKSSPTASRGHDLHTFMVGNVSEEPRRSGTSRMEAVNPAIGFFQGLDARYFMDQISGANMNAQQLQLEVLKKEMEIQNLKRDLREKKETVSTADRIFGVIEKNPALIERVLGAGTAANIGVLKSEKPIPDTTEDVDEENDEPEAYEPGKLDLNALADCAMRIQKAIPDQHVNDVLYDLTEWIEDNPETAANYLKIMKR